MELNLRNKPLKNSKVKTGNNTYNELADNFVGETAIGQSISQSQARIKYYFQPSTTKELWVGRTIENGGKSVKASEVKVDQVISTVEESSNIMEESEQQQYRF